MRPKINPKIKLMRDYQCYPFWGADFHPAATGSLTTTAFPRNIDPAALPLSENLVLRLSLWSRDYEKNVNLSSPFDALDVPQKSESDRRAEEVEGLRIWIDVRRELALKYDVVYHFAGRLLSSPDEHPDFATLV